MERLELNELKNDQHWWNLYERSFPEIEREPREAIYRSLEAGVGMAFRLTSNNITVGLASVHLLKEPDTVFLVYLAVADDFRGKSLGSSFFEYVCQESCLEIAKQGKTPIGIIWEVEKPGIAVAGDNEELNKVKRINFFRRRGAELMDVKYIQPPVSGSTALEMNLMMKPAAGNAGNYYYSELLWAIYLQKYSLVNEIDSSTLKRLYEHCTKA